RRATRRELSREELHVGQTPTRGLSSRSSICRIEVAIDHFSCRVFTLAATVCDRESRLYVVERGAPAFDHLADLAVADAIAKTNVHDDDTHSDSWQIQIQMGMIVN